MSTDIVVPRAWAPVLVASLALATCAVGLGRAHAALSAPPRCVTPRLVVWLETNEGGGAAGSVFYSLKFTNLARHACTLAGYPGVSAVDLRGRRLGSPAGRNPQQPFHVIKLAAGDTASAVLQISQAANFPAGACHPVAAAGVRVYPPSAFKSKVVPIPFSACSRSGPIYLHIERVR